MNTDFFVDIHCHPSIKAYAKSFRHKPGVQSSDPDHESSVWRRDKPSLFDKVKQYIATLTNFIQSDADSLLRGRVGVACLSFYPQERNFFDNKLGRGLPADLVTKLATEFGQERIDHIQSLTSYWEDLKKEMAFLKQMDNKPVKLGRKTVRYQVAKSYDDIELAARSGELGESLVLFVPTIEGLHIFDQVMDATIPWNTHPRGVPDAFWDELMKRAADLREGNDGLMRPLFVTFAHHFWNGLCGHEHSLGSTVKCVVDQENGTGQGFTEAGKAVIHALLDERHDSGNRLLKPVLIDIKPMSRLSREQYFAMLDTEFNGRSIPVVCSHAGVTGLSDPIRRQKTTPAAQEGLFMEDAINVFDDEILRISATSGLLGFQLDERRIGSKTALRAARGNIARREILYDWSRLLWNQVRHVAEVLDMAGRYAWDIQCLGTDFDGIIDPINGYWTAETLDELDDYLLKHAYNYLNSVKSQCPLLQERNRSISADVVVDRIMTGNALNFLSRNF